MDARSPLRAVIFTVILGAGLSACVTGTGPSPSGATVAPVTPSPVPSAPPSASDGRCGRCGPASSSGASPSPSSASCPVPTLDVVLRSDRMVGVEVDPGAAEDTIRFRFGPSSSDPGTWETAPTVHVQAASPPYASDPAGLPLDVPGAFVALVRMQSMWIYDEAGSPTYAGPARFDEPGPGLRSVVRAGAFEGYETWLVGFDAGCLAAALAPDGSLEVRVAH